MIVETVVICLFCAGVVLIGVEICALVWDFLEESENV